MYSQSQCAVPSPRKHGRSRPTGRPRAGGGRGHSGSGRELRGDTVESPIIYGTLSNIKKINATFLATPHTHRTAHTSAQCARTRADARARARGSLSLFSRASCPRCTCPAAARPRRARAVRTPVHKGKTYIKRNTVYIRPRPWLPSGMRHGARHWAGYTHIWNSSLRQRQAERPAHCLLVF